VNRSMHAEKKQESTSQSLSTAVTQKKSSADSTFQFIDNRPEATAQRELQDMADTSLQASQLKSIQEMADNSPRTKPTAQLRAMANNSSSQEQPIQKQENNTGLPDNLKMGMENLSGVSLDDVKVHRNSDKPAKLQAHAYAQGNEIHLGFGQEKHLPHEAWHVVQQKQGRVKPTIQMRGDVNVNDDSGLEREADVMGEKASTFQNSNQIFNIQPVSNSSINTQLKSAPIQMMSQEDRDRFYELKRIYSEKLKPLIHSNDAVGKDKSKKFLDDIIKQYYSNDFPEDIYKGFIEQANRLETEILDSSSTENKNDIDAHEPDQSNEEETSAFTIVKAKLDKLDETIDNAFPGSKVENDYYIFLSQFHTDITNEEVVKNKEARLEKLEWLIIHTVERSTAINGIEIERKDIDSRQWEQYQIDVKNAVATNAYATTIFTYFEAQDPGWLGGQPVERLQEVLERAMESMQLTNGWTNELEAAVNVVITAFVQQSSDENQAERNRKLDDEEKADRLAEEQAEEAAKNQAIKDARPNLPADFSSISWSQWGGQTGFQIPKSFILHSTEIQKITVFFQPNKDVTAKHLREYLDDQKNKNNTVDGTSARAYLVDMLGDFRMLTNTQINKHDKVRPTNWEFLFKAEGNTNRACYHTLPKSGKFHT